MDHSRSAALEQCRREARANLADSVMPFWAEHAWDADHGGFLTRVDRLGRRLETAPKYLMMQVRMLAALSWAHDFGLNDRGYLDLAAATFEFIETCFRDQENGGYYFTVTRDGKPLSRRKNTDVHAYALTGLSAYADSSGRPDVLETAGGLFELLQIEAADGEMGYREDFDGQDWPVLNAEQMHLSENGAIKTIDMHTNVLEGIAYLSEVSGDDRHLAALRKVFNLILSKGLDPNHGGTVTAFDSQWNAVPDSQGRFTTSYGLNVELAWLLIKAGQLLHVSWNHYGGPVQRLVDHALEYGFDPNNGGLASYGPMAGRVEHASNLADDRMVRSWWTQAELLNALVDMIELTSEDRYVEAVLTEWNWIRAFQIDHDHGDWYSEVDPASFRPVTTDKGGEWKTAFHVARALIRSSEGLERILGASERGSSA